jgi:hypothetical protein
VAAIAEKQDSAITDGGFKVSLFRNSQKMRRSTMVAALGVSVVLALGACSTSASPGASGGAATTGAGGGDLVLVQAVRSLSNPYHANWVAGGALFADSVGLKQVVLSDDGDSQTQLSQIKSLLTGGKKMILNVDPNTSSDTQALVRRSAMLGVTSSPSGTSPTPFTRGTSAITGSRTSPPMGT